MVTGTELLSPAEVARGDMASAGLETVTMAELVIALRYLPDGPNRARLEEWYWALCAERHGLRRTATWRWEYQWLRAKVAACNLSEVAA